MSVDNSVKYDVYKSAVANSANLNMSEILGGRKGDLRYVYFRIGVVHYSMFMKYSKGRVVPFIITIKNETERRKVLKQFEIIDLNNKIKSLITSPINDNNILTGG